MVLDRKTPLELYEARNAVRIARWTGADRYAADTLHKAEVGVQNAEEELSGKIGKKTVAQNARDAAQNAEDARLITIRKMQEEESANEKAAADQRDAEARADAEQAQRQKLKPSKPLPSQISLKDRRRLKPSALRARRKLKPNERPRKEAAALAPAAGRRRSSLPRLVSQLSRPKQEKSQLREQLRQQLNVILETRETARGLIINMSDVLFDTGKYSLKPGAREKLAKVSGIILAHPGLNLEVEGHTDSVGSDEYNQHLSEQRANSVRDYLVAQGISGGTISALGLGKTAPVTTNSTAVGRQQNRRVELVVSGEAIGTAVGQAAR